MVEFPQNVVDLAREDRRSWLLNAAALRKAEADWPRAVVLIESNLIRMEAAGWTSPLYIERCRVLLAEGIESMRSVFLALTDEGQVLRSVHPFAGLLTHEERIEIIKMTGPER